MDEASLRASRLGTQRAARAAVWEHTRDSAMQDLETRNPLKFLWGSNEEDVFSGGTQTVSSGADSL